MPTRTAPPPDQELRDRVEGARWYHTLELAPDLETPGWFDLRGIVDRVGLPESLEGRRCLDVGTFDGFWAFEMERRGGEVVAIDILDPDRWDWPAGSERGTVEAIAERKRAGSGFELAASVLSSAVERRELSVHELDPARDGTFDLVYVGSLLLHLRDPVGALTAVRGVCRGTLILCDAIDLPRSLLHPRSAVATLDGVGRPWWWRPNASALALMVEAAGFEVLRGPHRLRMPPGRGMEKPRPTPAVLRSAEGRRQLTHSRLGDPHAVIEARPRRLD